MGKLSSLLALALAAAACRAEPAAGVDGGADAVSGDAPPGVGCTATSPRAVTPETFVGPTGLEARLSALIDGAQRTLDVHMYLFTVRALADKLVAAKQRGVAVRLILDPDSQGNDIVRPTLAAGGVPTRDATALYAFSHAKYMIIDGSTAVIMSNNFNVDAMSKERNYGLVDRDPDDVADAQAVFDMDWAAAGGEPVMTADLGCTRLIVSPNNAKQRILELIGSATSTLEVEVMYLSETTVRNAIGAAKQRGVDVRVIIDDPQDASVPFFTGLGIPVRQPSFMLHAKLIVADGVAFVGSVNMSLTSMTKNRELGALVFEPAATAAITSQFDADWANSSAL